jgi:phage gpG-like protein
MGLVIRNLRAFQDLQRQVAEVARGELMPRIAKRVGPALLKQVADEFRESRNPYDKPWLPLARERSRNRRANARRARAGKARRASKPLIDTGRLRASPVARVDGTQVRVSLPVEYASYHQQGTRTIPRRQILPEQATGGLGERWTQAINREVDAVLKEHFKPR